MRFTLLLASTAWVSVLISNPVSAQKLSVDNLFDRVEEGFADSNGVKIHYVTIGHGPLALFIHGHPDQWFEWRNQMVALADTHKVVALSQRGYNKSDKPKGVQNYDIRLLMADVAAVIRQVGAEHAVIIGHDFGGIVAWHFTERFPKMVDGLVVFNNPHPRTRNRELATNKEQQDRSNYIAYYNTVFTEDPKSPQRPSNPGRVLAWQPGDIERLAEQKAGKVGTPLFDLYVEAYKRSDREAMVNFYRAYYGPPPWKINPAPPLKIQVPVLEFHGLADLAYVNQCLNDTWEWIEKDFTLITLPGVGHNTPYSGPVDSVTRMMTSWLELRRL